MKLREIINLLKADVLVGDGLLDEVEVDRCFSADLMSDVLGRSHANGILVTGITNPPGSADGRYCRYQGGLRGSREAAGSGHRDPGKTEGDPSFRHEAHDV